MVDRQSLIKKINALVDGLEYDFSRFEIREFVAWVAGKRGRLIELVPMQFSSDAFAAWVPDDEDLTDYVFYEPGLVEVRTNQFILHEIGHMLLRHQPRKLSQEISTLVRNLHHEPNPGLGTAAVGFLRSIDYSDDQEEEAETFSSLIQARVLDLSNTKLLRRQSSQNTELAHYMGDMGFDE
jgi:hypothetical protein